MNLLSLLVSISALAATVPSTQEQIEVSLADQVIRLVDKRDPGSSHKKVSVVVTDRGMGTDVSPRHTVYLSFASLAEMGNISASFKINDNAFQFLSAKRLSAGRYEVKTIEYRDEPGLVEVTQTINADKMFADEKKLRNNCGGDFCDKNLETSIEIQEKIKPAQF